MSGAALTGINYFLILAFLPGFEGVMQAYMVYKMLMGVTKNQAFPVVYAAIYLTLSHLTDF